MSGIDRRAEWLYLAATPTFALMALLTGAIGSTMPAICSSEAAALLGGMLPMYLLMSVFHSPPWLKRIARSMRRNER